MSIRSVGLGNVCWPRLHLGRDQKELVRGEGAGGQLPSLRTQLSAVGNRGISKSNGQEIIQTWKEGEVI